MIRCSFVGYEKALDSDLVLRFIQAVEAILSKGQDFEFYLLGCRPVYKLFHTVVFHLKKRYPEKNICSILVKTESNIYSPFSEPFYDKVIHPLDESDCNFAIQNGRAIRWCIDHSDYLVAYSYELLKGSGQKHLTYARKLTSLSIIDISSDDTRAALLNCLKLLPKRDQIILENIQYGKKMRAIAEQIGCTEKYTRILYSTACFKLISIHREQLRRTLIAANKPIPQCLLDHS